LWLSLWLSPVFGTSDLGEACREEWQKHHSLAGLSAKYPILI